MSKISAVALFCDDVREEANGLHTIIGVYGDNVEIPSVPIMIPKLVIYARMHLSVEIEPHDMVLHVLDYKDNIMTSSHFTKELVEKTIAQASEAGNKIAGFFSQIHASPFPVMEPGRFTVTLSIGSDTMYLGGLNFIINGI